MGVALRELAATGAALLIVEHKTDLLDGLCDRIAVIDGGRIVLDGHEFPDVEEVVERSPGYLVVEKIGDSRAYVEHLDPRSR